MTQNVGLFDRLHWWRTTQHARSRTMPMREKKSLKAELSVLKAVKALPNVVDAFHAIRVPNPSTMIGNGEVDLFVVTDRTCVLIEVKHWLGEISLVDGDLVQYKGKAPRKDSKPVLPHLHRKVADLKRWGSSLFGNAATEVLPLVVLTHPQAKLSNEVKLHPEIATLDTLADAMDYALQGYPQLERSEIENSIEMASLFGTWDVLESEGGGLWIGDLDDADLPEGWHRETVSHVTTEIMGGKFKTLLRGPKIRFTIHHVDGSETSTITPPNLTLRHRVPWGSSGLDGKGLYPVEFFSTVRFGHQNSVTVDENGRRTQTFHPRQIERLAKMPKASAKPTLKPSRTALAKEFPVNKVTSATVIRHLQNEGEPVHGLLVSLVERELKAMVPQSEVALIHPDLLDRFYRVGSIIEVKVTSNNGPKNIRVALA
jgi:hypothetical protein